MGEFKAHGGYKGVGGAFADGGLVVCAADMDADTGRAKGGGQLVDPGLKGGDGAKEMIVFRSIEAFPGEDIGVASKALDERRGETSLRGAVGEDLFVG